MTIETLALIFYIILVLLGFLTVWLGSPGTMLVLGAALVYDLFVRSTNIHWQTYIIMFALLGAGEIIDIVLTTYMKKPVLWANVIKLLLAIGMVAVFVMTI